MFFVEYTLKNISGSYVEMILIQPFDYFSMRMG